MKDWLLRAVSNALDDGASRLSLDCVQDHALPVEIYRQIVLDAYEGEQRLNHTASNREHVWRLLQGGELIAPVPPLPPRETPPEQGEVSPPSPVGAASPVDVAPMPPVEAPPSKRSSRGRKKVEAQALDSAEPGSMVQVGSGETPPAAPKRTRKKKTASETGAPAQTESTSTHAETSTALQAGTDALAKASPAKPKRTRRVGEPKPIRYPVGELENEQGM